MVRKRSSEGTRDVDLGGMFRSLGGFLDLLSDLGEKGEEGGEFTKSGEFGDDKKGVKAVYGFSVRVGGGGKPLVEQFGNVNVKEDGQGAVVEETREPMVDVFDEEDHLLLVAELPGVDAKDIHYELEDDVLSLNAVRGDRKYRKEILLPTPVLVKKASASFNNGVYELKLPKAA